MIEENLQRFLDAQEGSYATALAEIRSGQKRSHWMWYIFPQLAGLGRSETARHYAIRDEHEALSYLTHPVLGKRLIEISRALLALQGKSAHQIFGSPDDLKLHSCATLFSTLEVPESDVFREILDQYFGGRPDAATLQLLRHSA